MLQLGPGIVEDHPLLGAEECAAVSAQVLSLQEHWEARLGPYQFATLGCAAYLDGDDAGYAEKSRELNPLLRATFGDLYERLRLHFCGLLDAEAYYDEALSYPGFHLFQFEGNEVEVGAPADRAHFDYQFAKVFPDFAERVLAAPLTFTLPLEEPSTGSSLEMWDLRPEQHAAIDFEHKEFARQHPSRVIAYELGRVFCHDGLNLHAMGRIPAGTVGRRITLQGHAFKTERGWLLYW